jgi:hypothetical protein
MAVRALIGAHGGVLVPAWTFVRAGTGEVGCSERPVLIEMTNEIAVSTTARIE